VATLTALVKELNERLRQNSSNSSCPPSQDPPSTVPPKPRTPSGKKRGGQPGHKKHERGLLPDEQVTRRHELKPQECEGCGGRLFGVDPVPYRHQVVEMPRFVATVDEYQLHELFCGGCKIWTRAGLPDGVPTGNFGPRLQAMIAVCSGAYRLSKRSIEELVHDFFGVKISLGSICNLQHATSEALQVPVAQVVAAIKNSEIAHADETGWYEHGKRAWLWVALNTSLAVFLVRNSRGAVVAKELLGDAFAGLLVSDRWNGYNWLAVARRQLCWAHLNRLWTAFSERGGQAETLGHALLHETRQMFLWWSLVRCGTLSRADFGNQMVELQARTEALLDNGAVMDEGKTARQCREVLKLKGALWTFVRVEGVEPTNNTAERAVRHAVLWRRASFGTDSDNGSRFVERILTTVATLRLQKRNVLDFVTDVCQATLSGETPPSLLPVESPVALLAAA
jgi:transposase